MKKQILKNVLVIVAATLTCVTLLVKAPDSATPVPVSDGNRSETEQQMDGEKGENQGGQPGISPQNDYEELNTDRK